MSELLKESLNHVRIGEKRMNEDNDGTTTIKLLWEFGQGEEETGNVGPMASMLPKLMELIGINKDLIDYAKAQTYPVEIEGLDDSISFTLEGTPPEPAIVDGAKNKLKKYGITLYSLEDGLMVDWYCISSNKQAQKAMDLIAKLAGTPSPSVVSNPDDNFSDEDALIYTVKKLSIQQVNALNKLPNIEVI